MLAALGFYTYEVDGKFDWVTTPAVKAWQKSLGLEPDGSVQAESAARELALWF
jgi:peptidoglycan hydrolase-like protein with peptidoglycan-binding domain